MGYSPSYRDWSGYINYRLHKYQILIRDLGMIYSKNKEGDLTEIESSNFHQYISYL